MDFLFNLSKFIKVGCSLVFFYLGSQVYNAAPNLTIPIDIPAFLVCFLTGAYILKK